jgi:ABC-2 type transport system permease protein
MNTLARPALIVPNGPDVMSTARLVRAYVTEAKYEMLRLLRTIAFAVPLIVLPLGIYLLFGVLFARDVIAKEPAVANLLFAGFAVFATTGPAIFGVGIVLAMERDAGLMKLKRALPVPTGAYLLAKMATALFFGILTTSLMVVAGLLFGRLTLSFPQLAAMSTVLVIGTLPFAAIGLFIGAHVSGNAAPAVANLVYLPMAWLSGIFFPLPPMLRPWAVIWPAFHLDQVALAIAGLTQFRFINPWVSVAVLAGITVLFGGLALRRLARKD